VQVVSCLQQLCRMPVVCLALLLLWGAMSLVGKTCSAGVCVGVRDDFPSSFLGACCHTN
jgi:hypothetical protein